MAEVVLELARLAWPTEWSAIFDRRAPLGIEVGFGNGLYLLDLAQRRPEWNFLGIEIATPSIKRTERRVKQAGLDNVRLIRGDARSVLQLLCGHGLVSGVIINFPDPWPKAGHGERRLISMPFLELLASRMANRAELDIATDHVEYGVSIAKDLKASPYFESRSNATYLRDDPERIRTKYEQKGLAAGGNNFYFKWRRNFVAVPDHFPPIEELPMPHVVVNCPLTLEQMADCFVPRQCAVGGASIRMIDIFRSQQRPALIVDTYIAEQPLAQRLMIEIYRRPDADYLIRLQPTGFPRSTDGVHAAIGCLIEWLRSLNGRTAVVRHNLRVSIDDESANEV